MMDILDLRYLAAAANAGNFGRAAKSLGRKRRGGDIWLVAGDYDLLASWT